MNRNIAILGGGSPFTAALVDSILACRPGIEPSRITLIGRNATNLGIVADYARNRLGPSGWTIDATCEMAEGLRDAGIVVHQIRYGGWAGRRNDENIAAACGVPADETLGPAALASLARIVDPLRKTCELLVACCPDALVLNMTNPLSVVTALMTWHGVHRCIGLCELPRVTVLEAAALVGMEYRDVDWGYIGLNHRGFVTRLAAGGRNLIPEVADKLGTDRLGGISGRQIAQLGAIPTKYFRLLSEPDLEHEAAPVRRAEGLSELAGQLLGEMTADASSTPSSLSVRYLEWYPHAVVPFIAALSSPNPARLEGNLPLAMGIVEEGRLDASADGLGPLEQSPGGAGVREWVERFRRHERRMMDAVTRQDHASIRAAVAADPVIPSSKTDICARAVTSAFRNRATDHLSVAVC